MNEFELSDEAYAEIYPVRAAAKRRIRRALGPLWSPAYAVWKLRWVILGLAAASLMYLATSRWDHEAEGIRPAHIRVVR